MVSSLRVHPSFFKEFASKTWTSPYGVVAELIENSFDEDATKVVITLLRDGSVVVEDDVGMSAGDFESFLLVGSPHKAEERLSPKFGRPRSGRYGTGRLGFLTAFGKMVVRTRKQDHVKAVLVDEKVFEQLAGGEAELKSLDYPPLGRDGTEIKLMEPSIQVDPLKMRREIRRLAILRYPFFEVFLKEAAEFHAWSFEGAERMEPPQTEGLVIPVNLPDITGEVVVAKRPLPEEERGLAVIVGSHMVERRSFGFDVERITGWLRCDNLTTRFADKASIIENNAYEQFQSKVKTLMRDEVLPKAKGLIEAVITTEETRVYRKVDSLLANAVHIVLHPSDEVLEPWEAAGGTPVYSTSSYTEQTQTDRGAVGGEEQESVTAQPQPQPQEQTAGNTGTAVNEPPSAENVNQRIEPSMPSPTSISDETPTQLESNTQINTQISQIDGQPTEPITIQSRSLGKVRVRRTFTLKKVGFRVVPYEDEADEREAFAEGAVIYVNKAHKAYQAEALRGSNILLRHVVRLVSKVIALEKYPEGREALDLQNRLIAEAVRLTKQSD
ncbi:MAG: ATP-binding protein [Thaumarchaeota archaeon]|nr:ATP-binding protein [Nitrososphaerota archaeon]MCL5317890.1 ATP-binding protein [Nitrososphaerota archaeon]